MIPPNVLENSSEANNYLLGVLDHNGNFIELARMSIEFEYTHVSCSSPYFEHLTHAPQYIITDFANQTPVSLFDWTFDFDAIT